MKVYVNMEEGWKWWMDPRDPDNHWQNLPHNKPKSEIEIDDDTYREYQAIMKQAYVVQEALEHMYRHQVGIKPFAQSPYKEQYDNSENS